MSENKTDAVRIELSGRIDSNNSAKTEEDINARLEGCGSTAVILDGEALEYISSAGLRVVLRLKKNHPDLCIVNVCPEVYDILEMTGFTEMMRVERAYKVISTEGCEEIGRGANGTIYRIDRDNVVKVFNNAGALEDIQHEREVAKLALVLGIPTAISYDVVRVGDSYGSVYEFLNARSFSKIIAEEPDKLDWCVSEYVKMLKTIHGTKVPPGKLPDMKETAVGWARFMKDYLPEEDGDKLVLLMEGVPSDDHMIHGDYHTKNLELQNDEVLLIDMDTLAVGNPVFELASMFNAYVGFSETDPEVIKKFQGFDAETAREFWKKTLAAYLGTSSETKIKEVEDKARIVGYTRLIRRSIRRGGLDTESGRAEIEHWKEELLELLGRTDTLVFDPDELVIDALPANLGEVQSFVGEKLEAAGCSPKAMMQTDVVVEEVFVNIATYAYEPGTGKAKICVKISPDRSSAVITFTDSGMPYDPLSRQDPDISLPAEERGVGGLGVFMTKKLMDASSYEYRDGQNILTLRKNLF